MVWDETIQIMMDMFDNVWGDKSEVVVDHCIDITLPVRIPWLRSQIPPMSQHFHQIALFVIAVAGNLCHNLNRDGLMIVDTRIRASGYMDK